MANLRVKHDQIYNFPLQQHIEPQVNWSTVIEEKQVPRGPPVPLPSQHHQLGTGRTSCISPRRNRLLEAFLAAWYWEQHGKEVGSWRGWDKASCCGTRNRCSKRHRWPLLDELGQTSVLLHARMEIALLLQATCSSTPLS